MVIIILKFNLLLFIVYYYLLLDKPIFDNEKRLTNAFISGGIEAEIKEK